MKLMNLFRTLRNCLWSLCSVFPIKQKKAVCQSFYGRGFSDSPKAIALELSRRGYQVYWAVKGREEAASVPQGIRPLRTTGVAYVFHSCTAGIWVDSCRKSGFARKRKGQLYVQTWHGFPLKRIEKDAEASLPQEYIQAAKYDSSICDLFLSNSRFLTQVYRNGFWYDGEILEKGLPRNDILTQPHPEILEKVQRALSLPKGKKLLLYAPTFRKDRGLSAYDVEYARVASALRKTFGGDWLVLLKLHPGIAEKAGELALDPAVVRHASAYPDIQELYMACDALLTDYSSVMFDFMATGKPCFLYVNDLESYQGDRNFYFELDRLPYLRAANSEELAANIQSYSQEEQGKREEAFQAEFGFAETGHAARACVDWLVLKQKELIK